MYRVATGAEPAAVHRREGAVAWNKCGVPPGGDRGEAASSQWVLLIRRGPSSASLCVSPLGGCNLLEPWCRRPLLRLSSCAFKFAALPCPLTLVARALAARLPLPHNPDESEPLQTLAFSWTKLESVQCVVDLSLEIEGRRVLYRDR